MSNDVLLTEKDVAKAVEAIAAFGVAMQEASDAIVSAFRPVIAHYRERYPEAFDSEGNPLVDWVELISRQ